MVTVRKSIALPVSLYRHRGGLQVMVLIEYNVKVSIIVAMNSVFKMHKPLSISLTDLFNCNEGKDCTILSTVILLVEFTWL